MNNDLFKYARNGNTVEVIGNIFDNPELLEE
ncbi:YopX family protein [Mediterraneibacter gnavus]